MHLKQQYLVSGADGEGWFRSALAQGEQGSEHHGAPAARPPHERQQAQLDQLHSARQASAPHRPTKLAVSHTVADTCVVSDHRTTATLNLHTC